MEVITLKKELISKTKENLLFIEQIKTLPQSKLNKEPAVGSWSILQCIEHLNRYGFFYQTEINKIKTISKINETTFNSGYFGNKFANSMFPEASPIKKMKTFKSKNPANIVLKVKVLEEFKNQQEDLLKDLIKFEYLNLNQKVKTTLPIIKFKLGDTFRFVVNHNVRHIEQANRALATIS